VVKKLLVIANEVGDEIQARVPKDLQSLAFQFVANNNKLIYS